MSKDKSEDEARNFENGLTEDDEDELGSSSLGRVWFSNQTQTRRHCVISLIKITRSDRFIAHIYCK